MKIVAQTRHEENCIILFLDTDDIAEIPTLQKLFKAALMPCKTFGHFDEKGLHGWIKIPTRKVYSTSFDNKGAK